MREVTRAGFTSVIVGLALASCAERGTALRLSVSSEEPLVALRLSLQPNSDEMPVIYRLPTDGSTPSLPGVFVLRLADAEADVAVLMRGDTSDGRTLTAQGAVHCAARAVCALSVRLAPPRSPTGASCDAATRCASGFCVAGVCCDQACDGGCAVCAAADGATGDGTCTVRAADVTCRKSMGACDLEDRCDGVSRDCPDARARIGTVCRAAVAACDLAELCDGASADCPPNLSQCKAGNYCSVSGACVVSQANGATCDDPTTCASGFCAPGGVCCDTACTGACEQCRLAGGGTMLGGTCAAVAAGTASCRASTGACDPAEVCDGNSSICPADQKSMLISTIVDLDDLGSGSVTSKNDVFSTMLVGCAGAPTADTVSRVFLTFRSLLVPAGSMLTSVQLHGCVESGKADAAAYTTSFAVPLTQVAYPSATTTTTALPSSNGSTHDEITNLPTGSFSSGVQTQLELRANSEMCAIVAPQRIYSSGFSNGCAKQAFQLIVNRCSPTP